MPSRRAFTLVELLIVTAIVVVILGLLAPSLRRVQLSARTVKCLGNIRSLQLASVEYAADNRGLLIDVGLPHGGAANEEVAWINTLQKYYDTRLVVHSPLDKSPHWPVDEGGQGVPVPGSANSFRRTSYGCNNYLSRNYSPAAAVDPTLAADRLSKIPAPPSTVHFLMMADEGEYAGSDHVHVESWWVGAGAANLPPIKSATQMQTNAAGGPSKSWDARANYGFVDGHVETLPFSSVYLTNKINRFDPVPASNWTTATGMSPKN
jgi:prepilin-type N-terminal cleavage/methylation domain-containing protein/prepilin-type processing-associated H-X9-DG protein